MKIFKTQKSWLSDTDFKEEWLGNLVQLDEGRMHLIYADPKRDEENASSYWKEEIQSTVLDPILKLIEERDALQEKLNKRPKLSDAVLSVIYNEKTADQIIQLIKEGIC
jgi:hypothetical protein